MDIISVNTEATNLIRFLVEKGVADDQNYTFVKYTGDLQEITFDKARFLSVALKNRPYKEIYKDLLAQRAYSILLPDGA
ncbi:MAG: DUF2290 domain-containing protein, partial [Proteobacteria bacterium]